MEKITRKLIVSGRVQGVGFRYFVYQQARLLNISGTVKNLSNGKVEVIGCGEPSQIEKFITHCQKGPIGSTVEKITVTEMHLSENESRYQSFEIIN